ncbi:Na+/H+ antiporter subunit G [Marinospirillum insulare]|uniref:Monovalent cation/H+ antiporter subunit G n=1 Tax=Marinospirillum insulare TaxID=217169 RepID=A0ABQ5ZWT5_9GAMM|nr:Na+/H+ antiporter subunit G [Marinospirillum insulare]GLR64629.1 monovalent cation/H+ antiporter subunit G [Marinospirillum insulare]
MNWTELAISFFVLLGGLFMLIGSIGLARLPDFYMRLHAPTKATTLGVGSLLIASMLFFSIKNSMFSIHEVLITIFLFITAPVSAHMMAKAALHVDTQTLERTQGSEAHQAATARKSTPSEADLANKQEGSES